MKVIRARAMGMCFGVRDALAATRRVLHPDQVTIHGELVHNATVLGELRDRGFHINDEEDRASVPATPTVMVTAHGISDRERTRLTQAGKQLLDTTCPLVLNVHQAAQRLAADNRLVLLIGRHGHVEVRGVTEDLDRCEILEAPADVRAYDTARLGVVCQTTAPAELVHQIHAEILRTNPQADIAFANTVCGPTRERQTALTALLEVVEAVVVVGGRNSNNTQRLVERCEHARVPVVHVTGPGDLCPRWCARFTLVGLTAGTSTPDGVIDSVQSALRNLRATDASGQVHPDPSC